MNKLVDVGWYEQLLKDLRKLEYTGIVLTKWNIGKRIVEDELKFENPEYGSKRVENIAKDINMSSRDLYKCIQFAKKCDDVSKLDGKSWRYIYRTYLPEPRVQKKIEPLPAGKYNIIYADPPWEYYEGGHKNQSQHYNTLTVEELKSLPLDDIAAEDCLLFLWVTFPILDQAFDLIKWWGFDYYTVGFVWVKSKKDGEGLHFGPGNWTRSNAELCLIARKGSIERKDASISQIIYKPVQEHSRKPTIVKDKIVQLVGDLPRIELFARERHGGWDAWGDEA